MTKNIVPTFNLDSETPTTPTSSERIVFELLEEVDEEPAKIELQSEDLVGMTEFIKNLDVTFEIVSPIKDLDYAVSAIKASEPGSRVQEVKKEVVEPKYQKEEQVSFSFDLPITKSEPVKKEENKVLFELSEETREIKVNEPVQFVPVTELTDNGIIRYSLEEYTEMENVLLDSKPAPVIEEVIPEELNITMKKVELDSTVSTTLENISPIDMTIEETLKLRSEERRKKLKEFNYKFHTNNSKFDELEKEPAYKRSGLDINSTHINSAKSRISVGTDSNDDLQLRSNNSYLHDNVD